MKRERFQITYTKASSVQDCRSGLQVLQWLAPQYLGPLNYVVDLPDHWPLRSAGTNRLAEPPVKLTTAANQTGFPDCRPKDMERSARQRDFSRIVIHLPSAT